jgi:hypothetical protein
VKNPEVPFLKGNFEALHLEKAGIEAKEGFIR